ncbi:hypothetical protein ETAA8_05290 [Anatilimnocola aggregata]|uniref:Uncharacterized protein n=1 Tax=Anatilimnocola aggregata TaxID=2528021 RepID=A0A517Y5E1_9BACT|nr:hypothetical protein [Anatilimnocola aggregata]QDU25461.1 hypothetical protein ETAA8_05290 [Anatilimnocola aggregata]
MTKLSSESIDRRFQYHCNQLLTIAVCVAWSYGASVFADELGALGKRISVVGTRQYKKQTSALQVSPAAARKKMDDQLLSEGASIRYDLVCLFDDAYVFSVPVEKMGVRLFGYLVDGKTGKITATKRGQIDDMLGSAVDSGVMPHATFRSIKDLNDRP